MIRLPDTPTFASTGLGAPQVSAEAAAAPARALGTIAGAIGQASDGFVKLGHDLARIDNARTLSETNQQLAANYAQLQIDLQSVNDPQERLTKTNAFLAEQKSSLIPAGAPPVVRQALESGFSDFTSRAQINAAKDAADLTVKRATLALGNEIDASYQTLDPDAHRKALDNAAASGLLLPEQRAAEEARFGKAIAERQTTNDILADPDYWLTNNPKPAKGQNPAEWAKYKSMATSAFREETAQTIDEIEDGMAAGNISAPEQIDELAANLRPGVREELKARLANRSNEGLKAKLRDPEYQNQLIGQASSMLKAYDPNGEDFDSGYVAVDSVIRQLPPSAIRDELEKNLRDKRAGEETRIKTHAEEARAALEEHYDTLAKKIPTAQSTFSTTRAINDGLLRDTTKLTALGFNEEQVESIIGDEEDTDATRRARFREMSIYRDGEKTAGTFTTAAAEAILNGKDSFTVLNPEAEGQRILAERELAKNRGKSLRTLTDWLTTTGKDATEQQINSKIQELAGKDARVKLQSGFFEDKDAPAATPKGADPSTSSLPIGKDLSTVVKHFEAAGEKEGFHRAAYWDVKQWSIGYGTKSKKGEVIDKAEAERRLATELSSHRARVEAEAKRLGITFKPHEIDALTSFDYNTGSIKTLLANGTRTKADIAQAMLLYIKADGVDSNGLERRRAAERHIFLKGYGTQEDSDLAENNDPSLDDYNVITDDTLRPDGTKKGNGFLGVLTLPDGNIATEFSTQSQAVKVEGKQIDFPTLVPGLTPEEVQTMTQDIIPNRKPIPEPIMRKAIDHALARIKAGKSVFADPS
jgi:GH24 family phage-related lysozyme (muramidase)